MLLGQIHLADINGAPVKSRQGVKGGNGARKDGRGGVLKCVGSVARSQEGKHQKKVEQ